MLKLRIAGLLLVIVCDLKFLSVCAVPTVTIQALKSGSFRVYIPDTEGMQFFAFHANVNKPIPRQDPGDYSMEVNKKSESFWIATFTNANLKVGDTIYFWIFHIIKRSAYTESNLNTTISELFNEYPPLVALSSQCVRAVTIADGKETCVGEIILDEQFSGLDVNSESWIVEHWIPTYTPPSFIFNSYIDSTETRRVSNGILYLKPVAFQTDSEIRGVLDLRNGCTSKIENQCFFRSKSWSLLPPVKSAKINSRKSFKYGQIDVRAKLPTGDWLIPVIQLEQKNMENGGSSPIIWIAYSRGNQYSNGSEYDIGSRIVFGGPVLKVAEPDRSMYLVSKRSPTPFNQDFHVYSLQWKPGKMIFSIDNTEYGSVDISTSLVDDIDIRTAGKAPAGAFNKELAITLGVAVGGLTDFPDGFKSGKNAKPWSDDSLKFLKDFFDQRSVWGSTWDTDRAALQVDYVRVTAI